MASACLRAYQGDTLFYVGEGRGGVNADGQFFDTLEVLRPGQTVAGLLSMGP